MLARTKSSKRRPVLRPWRRRMAPHILIFVRQRYHRLGGIWSLNGGPLPSDLVIDHDQDDLSSASDSAVKSADEIDNKTCRLFIVTDPKANPTSWILDRNKVLPSDVQFLCVGIDTTSILKKMQPDRIVIAASADADLLTTLTRILPDSQLSALRENIATLLDELSELEPQEDILFSRYFAAQFEYLGFRLDSRFLIQHLLKSHVIGLVCGADDFDPVIVNPDFGLAYRVNPTDLFYIHGLVEKGYDIPSMELVAPLVNCLTDTLDSPSKLSAFKYPLILPQEFENALIVLHEFCQVNKLPMPIYQESVLPDETYSPFYCSVSVSTLTAAPKGYSRNKKLAKYAAAEAFILKYGMANKSNLLTNEEKSPKNNESVSPGDRSNGSSNKSLVSLADPPSWLLNHKPSINYVAMMFTYCARTRQDPPKYQYFTTLANKLLYGCKLNVEGNQYKVPATHSDQIMAKRMVTKSALLSLRIDLNQSNACVTPLSRFSHICSERLLQALDPAAVKDEIVSTLTSSSNPVSELNNLCQIHGHEPPKYSFDVVGESSFIGRARLHNKVIVTGDKQHSNKKNAKNEVAQKVLRLVAKKKVTS